MSVIRRISPEDGPLLRTLRLAALQTAPEAFSASYDEEHERTDEEWRTRAVAGASGSARATYFAEDADGPTGLVGGYRPEPTSSFVELVSMYVVLTARRRNVGRQLVAAVIDWAREIGVSEVRVGFTEGNAPAEELYRSCGFSPSDETRPFPLDPSRIEVRLVLPVA